MVFINAWEVVPSNAITTGAGKLHRHVDSSARASMDKECSFTFTRADKPNYRAVELMIRLMFCYVQAL